MKKLIAVIMILALLAPAAVLADRDPIVGSWYFLYDKHFILSLHPLSEMRTYP